jgi:hypothetical protein
LKGLKIECSYFLEGKMRDIEVVEIGTFTSIPPYKGVFFVEGNDIVIVKGNSDEMAVVKAQSICKLIRDSSSREVTGSNFYHSSNTKKLSFLNNVIGVREQLVERDDNIMYKVWEWKESNKF